jgi:hypothetical protein
LFSPSILLSLFPFGLFWPEAWSGSLGSGVSQGHVSKLAGWEEASVTHFASWETDLETVSEMETACLGFSRMCSLRSAVEGKVKTGQRVKMSDSVKWVCAHWRAHLLSGLLFKWTLALWSCPREVASSHPSRGCDLG